ncbi:NAD(P)-binding protein [Polyplosphaeria fusca]|uniref:NAD(P)-binding protein n=1 Tax=Polyplosphaeria fusca TaxID=682080 RepID=A0A9P4V7M5_9PLEO|nr:NAD(P)-binding protein [Polyplosphaeria fusca]
MPPRRILITGSSDGLGLLAAQRLISRGHHVTLHARNAQRSLDAQSACPNASSILIADLSSLSETKHMASTLAASPPYDCIIHNAGLYRGPFNATPDGIPALAAVNTVAPYVLTCLAPRPKRIVFLSSEMHQSGTGSSDPLWEQRGASAWSDTTAYCDSKLHNVMFAKGFADMWPGVCATSLDPGWVATKMGGSAASGDPEMAVATYVMLAEGEEEGAKKSGAYWRPGKREDRCNRVAEDEGARRRLFEALEKFTGVKPS